MRFPNLGSATWEFHVHMVDDLWWLCWSGGWRKVFKKDDEKAVRQEGRSCSGLRTVKEFAYLCGEVDVGKKGQRAVVARARCG